MLGLSSPRTCVCSQVPRATHETVVCTNTYNFEKEEPPEGFDPPTCSSFGAGVFACTYETAALPG